MKRSRLFFLIPIISAVIFCQIPGRGFFLNRLLGPKPVSIEQVRLQSTDVPASSVPLVQKALLPKIWATGDLVRLADGEGSLLSSGRVPFTGDTVVIRPGSSLSPPALLPPSFFSPILI